MGILIGREREWLTPYPLAMAVVALGLDLLSIERMQETIDRRGERFLDRVFTPAERAYCERRKRSTQSYAGRFAVKEAVMKVLGTGWARGVRWRDIEVLRSPGRPPEARLHGASARIADEQGIRRILVTITHDSGLAAAVAVGES